MLVLLLIYWINNIKYFTQGHFSDEEELIIVV